MAAHFKRSVGITSAETTNSSSVSTSGFANFFGTILDFEGTTNYVAEAERRVYQDNDNTLNAVYQINLVPDTTYRFLSTKGLTNDSAIFTLQIEDVSTGEVYATHSEDCYAASEAWEGYSFSFTFTPDDTISRSTIRSCYIRITNATKNGSSAGYKSYPFASFFCLHWVSTTNLRINPANSRSRFKWELFNTTFFSGTDSIAFTARAFQNFNNVAQTRYIDLPMIVGKFYNFAVGYWVYTGYRGKLQIVIKDTTGTITYNTLSLVDTNGVGSNAPETDNQTFLFQPTGYNIGVVVTTRWFMDNTLTSGASRDIIFISNGFSLQQET